MAQFHETGYGHRFFDVQLPRLTKALEDIGETLKSIEGKMTQKVTIDTETHEIKTLYVDPRKSWTNNELQFARLISEMVAHIGPDYLTALKNDMAGSMDLKRAELDELFDRAEESWERTKAAARRAGVSYD